MLQEQMDEVSTIAHSIQTQLVQLQRVNEAALERKACSSLSSCLTCTLTQATVSINICVYASACCVTDAAAPSKSPVQCALRVQVSTQLRLVPCCSTPAFNVTFHA